jgi:protein-S-isoprenylcysteine O-methyltransferase Ste14
MKKVLPPAYFLLALVVMVGLHAVFPAYRYWSFPLTVVGVLPLVVWILLNLVADREFKEEQTTVKPFEKSAVLTTKFPFSIGRHPMYLGMVLLLLGLALFFGTASSLLPVGGFAYIVNRVFVRGDEQMLAGTFGAEWERYQTRVRRWIWPRVVRQGQIPATPVRRLLSLRLASA